MSTSFHKLTLSVLLMLPFWGLFAQEDGLPVEEGEEETRIFSPGLSPVLLEKNQAEIIYFGTFASVPEVVSLQAPFRILDFSQRIHQSTLQLTYGFMKDPIFNLGLDVGYFRFATTSNIQDTTVSGSSFSLAPRLKWAPFKKLFPDRRSLFFQHIARIPVSYSDQLSGDIQWINQMVYVERFGYSFILQGQVDVNILPPAIPESKRVFSIPASVFAGYLINSRFMVFAILNYSPSLGEVDGTNDGKRYLQRSGTHGGGGLQLMYSERFNLFFTVQRTLVNYMGGGTNSLNFGLRLTN